MLATSDVPGGVVNLLTGPTAELAPVLAAHPDVDAIDLTGAAPERAGRAGAAGRGQRQAGALGRTRTGPPRPARSGMLSFLEIKTVWHPVGL